MPTQQLILFFCASFLTLTCLKYYVYIELQEFLAPIIPSLPQPVSSMCMQNRDLGVPVFEEQSRAIENLKKTLISRSKIYAIQD